MVLHGGGPTGRLLHVLMPKGKQSCHMVCACQSPPPTCRAASALVCPSRWASVRSRARAPLAATPSPTTRCSRAASSRRRSARCATTARRAGNARGMGGSRAQHAPAALPPVTAMWLCRLPAVLGRLPLLALLPNRLPSTNCSIAAARDDLLLCERPGPDHLCVLRHLEHVVEAGEQALPLPLPFALPILPALPAPAPGMACKRARAHSARQICTVHDCQSSRSGPGRRRCGTARSSTASACPPGMAPPAWSRLAAAAATAASEPRMLRQPASCDRKHAMLRHCASDWLPFKPGPSSACPNVMRQKTPRCEKRASSDRMPAY